MTKKRFFNISIITAALVVLAIISINLNTSNYSFENRGKLFLDNFTKNVNEITTISIRSFENNINLVKQNNSYISESSYPLKKGLWENLITSLSLLTIEELKTSDPSRHSQLNLLLPEQNKNKDEDEGYGTKITLKKEDGTIYSSILFGMVDRSVGGISGGQFARFPNEDQTYLLKGAIRMPTTKSDWFESLLLSIKKDDVQKINLSNKNGIIEIQPKDDKLSLTIPKSVNFKIDNTQLSDARDVINSFYFYDVKKSTKKYSKNLPTLSYEVKDGLVLTISSINPDNVGESWVIINAKSNDKKSEKMAQEITKKTKGYEFLANIITSDILRWKLKDLAAKDKKS
jgi:hypothetical protein